MTRTLLTLGLFLMFQLLNAQTKNFIDQPYLETTARVDTLVNPDIIYLDILIQEKDERNRVSVEELESRMIEKLNAIGIDIETQLVLTDMSSYFRRYFLKEKDIMKDKAYELKIFDPKMAGKVLVGLEEIGISNVGLNRTEYADMEKLRLELKSKAVTKAKAQADYLVAPLGQKVIRALYVSDKFYGIFGDSNRLEEVVMTGYGGSKGKEYQPPALEFRPIEVQSEVTIKFEIE